MRADDDPLVRERGAGPAADHVLARDRAAVRVGHLEIRRLDLQAEVGELLADPVARGEQPGGAEAGAVPGSQLGQVGEPALRVEAVDDLLHGRIRRLAGRRVQPVLPRDHFVRPDRAPLFVRIGPLRQRFACGEPAQLPAAAAREQLARRVRRFVAADRTQRQLVQAQVRQFAEHGRGARQRRFGGHLAREQQAVAEFEPPVHAATALERVDFGGVGGVDVDQHGALGGRRGGHGKGEQQRKHRGHGERPATASPRV